MSCEASQWVGRPLTGSVRPQTVGRLGWRFISCARVRVPHSAPSPHTGSSGDEGPYPNIGIFTIFVIGYKTKKMSQSVKFFLKEQFLVIEGLCEELCEPMQCQSYDVKEAYILEINSPFVTDLLSPILLPDPPH